MSLGRHMQRRRRQHTGSWARRLSLALTLGLPLTAAAEPTPAAPTSVEEAKKVLDGSRTEFEAAERRKQEIQRDLTSMSAERDELKKRLLDTAALVQKSETQMTAIEGRLSGLEADEKVLRGNLAARHGQIAKLLATLQRMGRNPPPVMITSREDALIMVRSAMLIASAFPEMRTQALDLSSKLNNLVRIMSDIRSESDRLKDETERLNATRTRLASLMDENKKSLDERQAELKQVREAAAQISKNVTDLQELITKLGAEVDKTESVREFNQESQRQIAAATEPPAASGSSASPETNSPAASSPPGDVALLTPPGPAAPSEPKPKTPAPAIELVPSGGSLVPGNPGRIKPAIAFQLAKGKLPLPAQGRRVLSYGDKTQYGGTSKGLVIETRFDAQVTSPCDGWVVYAGEFRSYGQLLIINAGGGYHVLVAGLSAIDVQPGQFVLAAEPVGTMSGAPRTAQLAVQAARGSSAQPGAAVSSPVLYVEFRKDGQPIDPDPWWVATNKKVLE